MADGIDRRQVLRLAGASVLAGAGGLAAGRWPLRAHDPGMRSGIRIARVSSWYVEAPRWKDIGPNARRPDHGRVARDTILILETDAGHVGTGPSSAGRQDAAKLLGRDPLSFYHPGQGLESPLGRRDMPLWDLVGQVLETPVWRLFGGFGAEWVPVYDGSFYFADLDPRYRGRGVGRILEEIDHSLAEGHRAFKLKVGRGFRWMEPGAGFRRDVEVVRAVRRHVGAGVPLMVDANDGYDPETARRFLDEVDDDLFWIEEMFPEEVEADLALKEWLRSRGWNTLIADGETISDPAEYEPFIRHRAVDVLQGNVKVFGLQLLGDLARSTAQAGIRLAPNNWESYLGLFAQLALARGIPNFLMAEQDPGVTDVFDVSAFEFTDGRRRVPETPGCGWAIIPGRLEERARFRWALE